MTSLWKGALALALFGAASAPMASGCVQAEAMFYIKNVKAQNCEDIGVDSPQLPIGKMDVRYSCSYIAILELNNQLVRRGDETKLQVETSRISVTAVDVQIFGADGSFVKEFTYPTSGFVDPANGTNPGRGLAGALLVDGEAASIMAASPGPYVVSVVAQGRTLGGDNIESRPFEFPIEVCVGCLCYAPTDDDCINSSENPTGCNIQQDYPFDCRILGGHTCDEPATCGNF
jgi:hypothetical protein